MAAQIPYADVLAQYQRAQTFGETRSLPEYSQHLNDLFGTDAYSAGMQDNWWKRTSTQIDQTIHNWTGGAFGDIGAGVGDMFGNAEAGRRVGEGLPRALLQSAPMYALGPEAGLPATASALGVTGGLFGAQTFADTGSAKQAVVSGLAAAAMPALGKLGGNVAARMFGGTAVRGELPTLVQDAAGSTLKNVPFNEVLPETVAQQSTVKLARFFGSQTAMAATQIASAYTQNRMAGGNESLLDAVSSPDFLLGQLPWTVFDAIHSANANVPTAEEIRPQLVTPKTGTPAPEPFVAKTNPNDEQAGQVQNLTQQLQAAAAIGNPQAVSDVFAKLRAAVDQPAAVGQTEKEATAATAQQQAEVPFDVIGRSVQYPSGDHRVLVDSNSNGEQAGDLTGGTFWIRGAEPTVDPTTGRLKFNVKASQMELAKVPLSESDFGEKLDVNQNPELGVPPPAPGFARFYHGGIPDPTGAGKWVSPQLDYAQGYADKTNGDVQYLDVPKNHPLLKKSFDDTGLPYEAPYSPFETDDELAKQFKPYPKTGGALDAMRTGLNSADVAALPQVGLQPEEAASVVQQSTDPATAQTIMPQVQNAVQKHEQSQTLEANARAKTDAAPTTSAEIPGLLKDPVGSREALAQTVTEGASPTQAVQEQVLKDNTPDVDKALTKQNAQKRKLSDIAKIEYAKLVESGNALITAYTQAASMPDHPLADAGNAILRTLKDTTSVKDPKFTDRIAAATSKWAMGEYGEATAPKLQAVLYKVKQTASKEPAGTWQSLLVEGKAVKGSQEEMQAYLKEHPELDQQGYTITPVKRKNKGGERTEYYIKKRPDMATSLDQSVGEGESTLGDIIKPAESTPVDNRPKVSRLDILSMAQELLRDPVAFAAENATATNPAEDVTHQLSQYVEAKQLQNEEKYGAGTQGFLDELNRRLEAKGLETFVDKSDLSEVLGNVDYWVQNYSGLSRDRTLESQVPGDQELARTMGLFDGPQGMAKWVASQKQSMGMISDIMEAVLHTGLLRDDTLVHLPGMEDHVPNEFFMRSGQPEFGLPQELNLGYWPSKDNIVGYARKMTHELIHLAEKDFSQRNDPQAREYGKARTAVMETLRKSTAVPKKVRQAFETIQKSNDFERLVMSEDNNEVQSIFHGWRKLVGGEGNDAYLSFIYALQNEHETIASLFSDPRMVAIAEQTQMPNKGGVLDSALNFLSRAFSRLGLGGRAPDNAMSFALKSFDNYLTSGFLKRTYDGSQYIHDALMQQGVRPEQLASRMQTVDATFKRPTLDASIAGFKREQENALSPKMNAQGQVHPALEEALRGQDIAAVHDHTMNLLAEELPVHADLLRRLSQDLKMTSDLQGFVKDGSVPGSLPPNAEKTLSQSQALVGAFAKAMKKQALAMDRLTQINNFDPAVWLGSLGDQLTGKSFTRTPDEVPNAEEVRALVGQERLAGGGMNPLLKNFALAQHVAGMVPATKPVIGGVFDEQGNATARNTLLNGAWIFDSRGRDVSRAILKSNQRVAEIPSLTEAAADIQRFQNREMSMKLVTGQEHDIKQILQRFRPEDQAAIMQVVESNINRHSVYIGHMQDTMGQVNMHLTAQIIQSLQKGILPDQSRQISRQLYEGLAQLMDPQQSPMGAEVLKGVSGQLDPGVYLKALQHAQATSQITAKWIDTLRQNPGYTTEQRYGSDYLVMMDKNGKKATFSGTRQQLQSYSNEYQAKGYSVADYVAAGDKNKPNLGMTDNFLSSIDQLDAQRKQVVSKILVDQPELRDQILPLVGSATDARTEIAASSPLPNVKRNFSEGRDKINMIDNSNQFYQRMNNWMRVRTTRARTTLDMMHPDVASNTELTNFLQQHVDNFLTPDNPIARKINQTMFFYKLALDAGQAMLWGTQNLTTGISTLMGETGSVGDAFKYWGSAVKDFAQWKTTKTYSSPELEAVINRASSRGRMGGLTAWSNIFDEQHNLLMDANAGKLAKAISPLKTLAMSPTTFMSQYNDAVGLLSAFKLGKDRGMNFDDAYSFAEDAQLRGHFNGGKAQRSVGLFSIKTRAVPQLLGALKSYSLGWFGQMAEQYTKGFGRAPEGTTATQRAGSKKAFLYGLAAQFALAGSLGLPGVGQGLALLSQATGEDYKGKLRQNLASLFDEDQTYGGTMTGIAMRGLGNVGLPFDPSSRASIAVPFIGVDERNGFSVANLGGSAMTQLGDWMTGALGTLHGDTQAVDKLLPNFLKRPVTLLQGEGDVRGTGGTLITELSPAERYMMALGLTPSRVQTTRDIADAVKKVNVQAQRSREAVVNEFASQIRTGDTDGARTSINQYLQANPDVQAHELVNAVSNRVVAQSYPFDPREALQPGANLGGLVSGLPANNVSRLQTKVAVQRSLGQSPGMGLGSKMFQAGQLDQTMDADQTMGLREARQQVGGNRTQPSQPSTFLLSPVLPGAYQGGLWWQGQQ